MSENRLSQTASPYLLQHKDNPVAWWPWSAAALAEAKTTNKPILLSIGYAACHWCHVMAHESFEDEATARVMNELFVNIKVDREERPDIDQIYMNALHHLGEHGGWPLTMFLTPDGEPVWGGTYFPKTARYGKPAFIDILRELARIFRDEPEKVDQNRAALMQRLAERARPAGIVTIGPRELDTVSERILQLIDMDHGGIGGAPKFPQCSALELLWRAGARTSDPRYAARVGFTLEKISEGGIYDHLGGGYSRYAVDARWLVPHFEKMLYDNAQLLELLALGFRETANPLFRARMFETVDWLKREMRNQEGAFAASLDADSEGEEGRFYVWTEAEIHDVLGDDDAAYFAEFYDVTPGGNWEGHTILNRLTAPARSEDEETRLTALRQKLLGRRSGRVSPGLDDKILADWNGMMIAALANVGGMIGEHEFIDLAARAFHFIDRAMTVGDRLGHSWRDGHLLFPGLASDHVHMIRAALALHEVTAERVCLDRAVAWQNALDQHFSNSSGYYFLTADDAEGLIVRPNATNDDALPNHNAIAAQNLVRLATLVGSDTFREAADRLFDGLLPLAGDNLFAHSALLNALDLRLHALEIVITGTSARSEALANAALSLPFTNRMLLRATTKETLAPKHPARDKIETAPDGTAFVCSGATCSLPINDSESLREALKTRPRQPAA